MLAVLYPAFILYTGLVLTETLGTFLAAVALYMLTRGILNKGEWKWRVTCSDNEGNLGISPLSYFTVTSLADGGGSISVEKLTIALESPADEASTSSRKTNFVYIPKSSVQVKKCELYIGGKVVATDEVINSFSQEMGKRSLFQYETTEEIKKGKANTSVERAKEFIFEMEKLLYNMIILLQIKEHTTRLWIL